jgi:hypothetical protein
MKNISPVDDTFTKSPAYKYIKREHSIKDYWMNLYEIIDCLPVGQRLDVDPDSEYTKFAGIIESIMLGMNIGEITIHKTNSDKSDGKKFDSIDGGHRKRAIAAFCQQQFKDPCTGKYLREFNEDEKKHFYNYTMSFIVYEDLPVWDVGYIFRTLNTTSKVTHQETLNSYGDIAIANVIRETVRIVKGLNNKPHKLFWNITTNDGKASFENLKFDNNRLIVDEMVARMYARYIFSNGSSEAKDLEKMYESGIDKKELDKVTEKVNNQLDFILEIAKLHLVKYGSNRKLVKNRFSLYSRIWFWMVEEYGDFKIPDYNAFFEEIQKEAKPFFDPLERQPEFLKKTMKSIDSDKTKGQLFKSMLGEHGTTEHINVKLNWLMELCDMEKIVLPKDTKRFFPEKDRMDKLTEQDFKCAIDGKELLMKDAQGAHKKAHSNGGKTNYKNLAMVRTCYNKDMGSTDLDDYKEFINDSKAA